jgi:hypothetical protein
MYEDIDIVSTFINEADEFGLTAEMVTYALHALKNDPTLSIVAALERGFYEWVK